MDEFPRKYGIVVALVCFLLLTSRIRRPESWREGKKRRSEAVLSRVFTHNCGCHTATRACITKRSCVASHDRRHFWLKEKREKAICDLISLRHILNFFSVLIGFVGAVWIANCVDFGRRGTNGKKEATRKKFAANDRNKCLHNNNSRM